MTPSTPPRSARRHDRPRTPPSPTHGPLHHDYEPYSPRRSTRTSNNPFSSSNITKPLSGNVPPLCGKKTTFSLGFEPSDLLSSPPTSPERPRQADDNQNSFLLTKTPRRLGKQNAANLHDNTDPSSSTHKTFLPTPSKTPSKTPTTTSARKHNRTASMQESARILHFQSENPADVMAGRRGTRKHVHTANAAGFSLDDTDFGRGKKRTNPSFEIYTESHARVPQMDVSDENPFVRPRANTVPQRRTSPRQSRKSAEQIEEERLMDEAAERDEGIVYMFRGKKVFRKFASEVDASSDSDARDPSASHRQRALRRSAGPTAERTITRSSMRPRLLFPRHDQPLQSSDVDEEAETDIEIAAPSAVTEAPKTSKPSVPNTPAKGRAAHMLSPPSRSRASRKTDAGKGPMYDNDVESQITALPTPAQSSKKKVSIDPIPVYDERTPEPEAASPMSGYQGAPPTPGRSTRKKTATSHLSPLIEDEQESSSAGPRDVTPVPSSSSSKRKVPSPFDSWPRTKSGAKRAGEKLESGSTKRTRSNAATEAA
ncbi:Hypothetical predicted protein [Lecanosticta acicola]|uniref:Uncharacterized protein n=1 Tax=Lecanosticta acicola TaxID=111012 RepID=A0AAI9E7A8_9PEZI|nr:Hypothetical predicted protein [Lecanosticta acicola]